MGGYKGQLSPDNYQTKTGQNITQGAMGRNHGRPVYKNRF